LTELNYSLLSCAILCKILEMTDVETPNNRATSAKDIPNPFINRSSISERPRGMPASVSAPKIPRRFTKF
jgi:hypothetical protein